MNFVIPCKQGNVLSEFYFFFISDFLTFRVNSTNIGITEVVILNFRGGSTFYTRFQQNLKKKKTYNVQKLFSDTGSHSTRIKN